MSSSLIGVLKDVVAQLVEQYLIYTSSVNFCELLAAKRVIIRSQGANKGEADEAKCFILLCDSGSTASWDYIVVIDGASHSQLPFVEQFLMSGKGDLSALLRP